jgi:hypothetical protein
VKEAALGVTVVLVLDVEELLPAHATRITGSIKMERVCRYFIGRASYKILEISLVYIDKN